MLNRRGFLRTLAAAAAGAILAPVVELLPPALPPMQLAQSAQPVWIVGYCVLETVTMMIRREPYQLEFFTLESLPCSVTSK